MAKNRQDVEGPTEEELAELEPEDGIFMVPLSEEDLKALKEMGRPLRPAAGLGVDGRSGPAVDKKPGP